MSDKRENGTDLELLQHTISKTKLTDRKKVRDACDVAGLFGKSYLVQGMHLLYTISPLYGTTFGVTTFNVFLCNSHNIRMSGA